MNCTTASWSPCRMRLTRESSGDDMMNPLARMRTGTMPAEPRTGELHPIPPGGAGKVVSLDFQSGNSLPVLPCQYVHRGLQPEGEIVSVRSQQPEAHAVNVAATWTIL